MNANLAATGRAGDARLDTGPSREATSAPKGGADHRSGPPPVKATASRPLSSRAHASAAHKAANLQYASKPARK